MVKRKNGIDISKWQGNIDAVKIKRSGIEFVIIREGYRQSIDSGFLCYVKKCKAASLEIKGVYHFLYALNVEQAKEEALSCIKHLEEAGLGKDTIVFSDFEYDTVNNAKKSGITLTRTECNSFTEAFCEMVESLGYKAGIYFNVDYYKNWYDHSLLDKYVKWLADWSGDADYPCHFHQYSSNGSVSGINGKVDMNYYFEESKETEDFFNTGGDNMGYKMIAASKDENGKYIGGKAGDQTGKEVWEYAFNDRRAYYYWQPLTQDIADAIYASAKAMADNNKIGYDQGNRTTAWEAYKKCGSIKRISTPCECDCSSGLRMILHEALGLDIGNQTTAGIPAALDKQTKYFAKRQVFSASKKIPTGSPLCTQVKGHTGVLSNGYKVAQCTSGAATSTPATSGKCYPKYTGSSGSIVDALAAVGEKDTSKDHRAKIAAANGINGYNFSESQNGTLLHLLKSGKLKKP